MSILPAVLSALLLSSCTAQPSPQMSDAPSFAASSNSPASSTPTSTTPTTSTASPSISTPAASSSASQSSRPSLTPPPTIAPPAPSSSGTIYPAPTHPEPSPTVKQDLNAKVQKELLLAKAALDSGRFAKDATELNSYFGVGTYIQRYQGDVVDKKPVYCLIAGSVTGKDYLVTTNSSVKAGSTCPSNSANW